MAASPIRTAPMFTSAGKFAAGLDFDMKPVARSIHAPQRMVIPLPAITTTAEVVTPAERGIGNLPDTVPIYRCTVFAQTIR